MNCSKRNMCTQASRLWLLGISCLLEGDDGGGRLGIGGGRTRKGVCHYIFHTRDVTYISSVFSYITELSLLLRRLGIGAAAECIGEGAMICPHLKLPTLYLKTEVSNGGPAPPAATGLLTSPRSYLACGWLPKRTPAYLQRS